MGPKTKEQQPHAAHPHQTPLFPAWDNFSLVDCWQPETGIDDIRQENTGLYQF